MFAKKCKNIVINNKKITDYDSSLIEIEIL